MKKIINGKKYDTDTAKEIGFWENEYNKFDFNFVKETLYQKRTGEFFLFGEGGANSKYARQCGRNSWDSGVEIIPLDFQSAKDWAEENLGVETFEKFFGEVSEDDEKRIVSFSLPVDLHEKIKRVSSLIGVGPSQYVTLVFDSLLGSTDDGYLIINKYFHCGKISSSEFDYLIDFLNLENRNDNEDLNLIISILNSLKI